MDCCAHVQILLIEPMMLKAVFDLITIGLIGVRYIDSNQSERTTKSARAWAGLWGGISFVASLFIISQTGNPWIFLTVPLVYILLDYFFFFRGNTELRQ